LPPCGQVQVPSLRCVDARMCEVRVALICNGIGSFVESILLCIALNK